VLPVFPGVASTTKFFLVAFAICVICAAPQRAAAGQIPPSYLIVDSQTGYVLIEQNAREKRQIASLTKVATACVVLDWAEKRGGDLGQLATISQGAFVGVEKNEVGWQAGDVVSLRDLLYAALVLLRPWVDATYGLNLDIDAPTQREWLMLAAIVLAGFLAGLLPAARAYRLSLADGMTVRT